MAPARAAGATQLYLSIAPVLLLLLLSAELPGAAATSSQPFRHVRPRIAAPRQRSPRRARVVMSRPWGSVPSAPPRRATNGDCHRILYEVETSNPVTSSTTAAQVYQLLNDTCRGILVEYDPGWEWVPDYNVSTFPGTYKWRIQCQRCLWGLKDTIMMW
jgi:hypothetical protein